MRAIVRAKLTYRLLILSGLALCLWAVSVQTRPPEDTFLPIVITEQLTPKDGAIPVYLFCGQARLSSPNRVEEFQCAFKNNTNLRITAANTAYTVLFEKDGSSSRDTSNLTIETLIHPDFRTTSKLIESGEEVSVKPPGPISYEKNVAIKQIEIAIDYVEFENGMTLGPDKEGSRIIGAMRSGAQKYRAWLRGKYNGYGHSLSALETDLAASEMPSEIRTRPDEQQGAIEYRRQFRKLVQTRSAADIQKLFASNQ